MLINILNIYGGEFPCDFIPVVFTDEHSELFKREHFRIINEYLVFSVLFSSFIVYLSLSKAAVLNQMIT